MMTLYKAINAARDKALIKNPISEWAIGQNAGVESMYRNLLAALPDKPKSEDQILNIISQECWKKEPMIPQRIFDALKAANVLFVKED